jgi:hypothetical protein
VTLAPVVETGPVLPTSPLVATVLLPQDAQAGILQGKTQLSTEMHMATQHQAVVLRPLLLAALVTDSGETESTLPDLPTHVWSESFSA